MAKSINYTLKMKPLFISILLFLLLGSCENRVEEKQYFASEEPPATPLPDKAPPIPYVDILKLNYEDYINRYKDKHHPKSEVTFIMNDLYDGIISEFRVGLYNCFSQKESKENDILIKEVTWDISYLDNKYLTVWYHREGKHWVPIEHLLYSKDTRF